MHKSPVTQKDPPNISSPENKPPKNAHKPL